MADLSRNPDALRMIKCYFCGASNFIQPGFAPGSQMPCTKCSKEILVPFMLRHFEVRQAIASGGMGTVYRAYDTVLQREVAVKLMKPELGRDAKKLDEFYREAKVIAALNHPHIIQVFHFGETDGQNFIGMEIADHGSLEDRMKKTGKVSEADVLDVGIKIGMALGYALEKDLLHRDLKPANILYNAAGEPKLVDWGLATKTGAATEWGSGEIWGTPEYVAPEKVRREGESFLSDMYSLGATLYEALTGQVPFKCATVQETVNAHVHTPVTPPKKLVPEISDATNEAITRLLAKNPKERFASYEQMVETLAAARSGLLVAKFEADEALASPGQRKTGRIGAATNGARGTAGTPRKGKTGLLVGAAVVVVALAAGAFFVLKKPAEEIVVEPPPDPSTNVVAQTNLAVATNLATTNTYKPVVPIGRPQMTQPPISLTEGAAQNAWRAWGQNKAFPSNTWKFASGVLTVISTNRTTIVVKERFIDFELTFEWKADKDTRAGIIFALNEGIPDGPGSAFRIPLVGDESSLQGGATGRNTTGALAQLFAPTNKVLKPLGQFNQTRLVVHYNKVEVWLNNVKVNDWQVGSKKLDGAIAKSAQLKERPYYGKTTSGYVGFTASPGFAVRGARIRAIAEYPKPPAGSAAPVAPAVPKSPGGKKKK